MEKVISLFQSVKFWALVASSAAIWTAYSVGGLSIQEAINAQVAALAAFSVARGIAESGGRWG